MTGKNTGSPILTLLEISMIDEDKYYMDWDVFGNNADDAQKMFPIKDVLAVHFGITPNSVGRCPCPIHGGHKPNMAIYENENKVHCFSDCGRSWDAISLVQNDLQNQGYSQGSYKKAFLTLCDEFGMDPLSFPGISLRHETRTKTETKQVSDLEKLFQSKHPNYKKLLYLSRNPFQPMVQKHLSPDGKETLTTYHITDKEVAFMVFQELKRKAKDLHRVMVLTNNILGENTSPAFQELAHCYDNILKAVQKVGMEEPENKDDLKKALELDQKSREYKTLPFPNLFDRYDMTEVEFDRENPSVPLKSVSMEEVENGAWSPIPKLFDRKTEDFIRDEFHFPIPHTGDVIPSPDGRFIAVPDVPAWCDKAFIYVDSKKDLLNTLSDTLTKEFKDFSKATDMLSILQEEIQRKLAYCDRMEEILFDIKDHEKAHEEEKEHEEESSLER